MNNEYLKKLADLHDTFRKFHGAIEAYNNLFKFNGHQDLH